MFAIDSRSLAAFRIGVGLLILLDLAIRAGDLQVFYTDEGLVPRILRIESLGYGDPLGFQHQWSLHMGNGEGWSQTLLMLVAAWFAIWLTVGYRTKLAAVTSWILLLSLHNRNPLILDAGDSLLRAMLFWSLFLPLGSTWSLDRWLHRSRSSETRTISSVATAALLLQLAVMYFASAAFKLHPVWTRELSAVYYTLHGDTFVTEWGVRLRDYPRLMQGLTVATLLLESLGPLLAFSPWRTPWFRLGAIVAFTLFHLGLAVTMTLSFFPWICIVCWLLFLPGSVWDWLESRRVVTKVCFAVATTIRPLLQRLPRRWQRTAIRRAERPRDGTPPWQQVIAGILFLYIVVWNVREVLGREWIERVMSHRWNGPAIALGLAQNWSMFAPIPRFEDGWLVMKGTLEDGSEVNLWSPGEPLPWNKPRLVSRTFPNGRWRRYLENLPVDQFAYHRQFLADWLQRRWDRDVAGGDEKKRVVKVELIRMLETTPPPGESIPEPEPVEICVRHY